MGTTMQVAVILKFSAGGLRAVIALGALFLWLSASLAGRAFAAGLEEPNGPSGQINASLYASVGEPLREAGVASLTEVRGRYLAWATNLVLGELAGAGQPVSSESVTEIMADTEVRDAVFRSVYPPDPSILQNYLRLRAELSSTDASRFQSLIIAFAVAKRIQGVQTDNRVDFAVDLTKKFSKAEKNGKDKYGNYQAAFWGDGSYLKPLKGRDKELVKAIAEFIETNQTTARQLYESDPLRQRLIQHLEKEGLGAQAGKVKQSVEFGELLKHALVAMGLRPETRTQRPNTIDWMNHLISLCGARPESTPVLKGKPLPWPLFPVESAPWPLLLPLARPVPLDEACYMWETFQGQHGPDRYHTYGPYRNDGTAMPYELEPSKWFWAAVPDRIVHGGECVPLSLATVDLYSCLAKPAVWAGQPGHANLISYERDQGRWTAKMEQAFAGGPDVTFAQWYFDDPEGAELRFRELYNWAGAEYHLGLALAMNQGLESYFDTRMAANIFGAMPADRRATDGKMLLERVNAANPFNPNIWYQLATSATNVAESIKLVQDLAGRKPAEQASYWKTVNKFVVQYAVFDKPPPAQKAELAALCEMLKKLPGLKEDQVKNYAARAN